MSKDSSPRAGEESTPRPVYLPSEPGSTYSPFRPFHLWKGRYFAPLAGVLIALIVFLISLSPVAEIFEWRTLDMRFQHRGLQPIESDLAVVFIGDDSISAFGRWPWDWDYHALLVDILQRHGARAVIFDVLFAESPSARDEGLFSAAMEGAGNVYLCSYFEVGDNEHPGRPKVGYRLTEPVDSLKDAARGVGHCNAVPDRDGITRRIPLLVRHEDGYYPSVAFKVVMDQMGISVDDLSLDTGSSIDLPLLPGGDRVSIPMDDEGLTMVNFVGGLDAFEQYSYLQILQADSFPEMSALDLEDFRDKIVLVGATFAGNTDLRPTPMDQTYPMLLILGNTIDSILQDNFIHRSPLPARLAMVIFLGALTGFLVYALRPVFSLTSTVFLMGATLWSSFYLFGRYNLWVDTIAALAVILTNYLIMTTMQYIQNRRAKMRFLENLKYMYDLVESSNDAIISFDMRGRVATWNRGAEMIFGLDRNTALRSTWERLISPADREEVREAIETAHNDGKPSRLEVTGQREKDEEFPVSLNISPVEDSQGVMVGISGISQDLTEKKQMVSLLVQSEKMAELGRLGSGIVHEIKNPLTSIMMLTGMVLAMDGLDDKATKYIGIIDQESQRILRLTQNILSFARPKKAEMKPMDLNLVIEETVSLVEYELKKNKVKLKTDFQDGGTTVLGDDEKLKQVFLNLIINAVHAMEGGGVLEIVTRTVEGDLEEIPEGFHSRSVGQIRSSSCGIVQIKDEGCGIPGDVLDSIYEPFFTTKAEGKGTGLGLYISQNILLEHKGRLTAASRPGTGTIFFVSVPAP